MSFLRKTAAVLTRLNTDMKFIIKYKDGSYDRKSGFPVTKDDATRYETRELAEEDAKSLINVDKIEEEGEQITRDTLTVVFKIKNREEVAALYAAHLNGTTICGMSPESISWGDEVSIPSEIVEGVNELDPYCPDSKALKELVEMAENHLRSKTIPFKTMAKPQ